MILSPDNRCPICQTKTHHYKRDGLFFCSRCCRSFAARSGAWIANWAWVVGPDGGEDLVPAKPDEDYAKVTGPQALRQPTQKSRPSAHKGLSTDAWPPEKIEKLRKLWLEGVPATEIGRQLKATKNVIVGKAHRVGLPSRESPIVRNWPPERIAKLRELWLEGVPVTEIGRQLKATKSAILGKAHRLGLSRESPIARRVTPPAVKIKRAVGSTLPPLQSEML